MEKTKVSDVEWLKPSELAQRWNMSPRTIQRWIRTGKLTAMKRLGNPRIHISVVEELEQEGKSKRRAVASVPLRRRRYFREVPDWFGQE